MKKLFLLLPVLVLLGAACEKTVFNTSTTNSVADANTPDLLIEHLGFNLAPYNASTGMAGDVKFTNAALEEDRLWMDFGYIIKPNSAMPNPRGNPQPTIFLPVGTKVYSIVDGVVVAVPKLYSGDYSVQVASSRNSVWIYEMEHVVNPTVKVGDRVTAGQVVAEVGNWGAGSTGLGMYEIGILKGGNPPSHVCPFAYLDPAVKTDIQAKLTQLYQDWEAYKGNTSLYNEAAMPVIGCQSLEAIPG